MNHDFHKYVEYMAWLGSLPKAIESGEYRQPGTVCDQDTFEISGRSGRFLIWPITSASEDCVVAALRTGQHLKARLFSRLIEDQN